MQTHPLISLGATPMKAAHLGYRDSQGRFIPFGSAVEFRPGHWTVFYLDGEVNFTTTTRQLIRKIKRVIRWHRAFEGMPVEVSFEGMYVTIEDVPGEPFTTIKATHDALRRLNRNVHRGSEHAATGRNRVRKGKT